MDHRLTLEERDGIAIELRKHLLSQEDEARLASIEQHDLLPNHINKGVYAFEFLLNRYRDVLINGISKWVAYSMGWSKIALLIDEQSRSNDRLIRMCANLCMKTAEERGEIVALTEKWKLAELGEFPLIDDYTLNRFLYEILYELVRELAREGVNKNWDKKTE